MVTPDRRRAVLVLQERFGVSQRRACRVVGQWRSTRRRPARPIPAIDEQLRRRLRRFARNHPRLGWRKAHVVVRREGWVVNHKKLRRLWREEGLRRPPPAKNKKRRPGTSEATLLRAEHPNHVWGLDFQFDETADLRRLKLLNLVDEHTREALAMDVDRSMGADQVVAVIERLVAERGAPGHLRMENGPELIAWALPDWCYLSGIATIYIEPGSPWETPGSSHSTTGPQRAVEHHRVRLGHRSKSCRRLEERMQYLATPLVVRGPHPRRVRCPVHPPTPADTPITVGPTTGAPSSSRLPTSR